MQAVYDWSRLLLLFSSLLLSLCLFDMFFSDAIQHIDSTLESDYLLPFVILLQSFTFLLDRVTLHYHCYNLCVVCMVSVPTLVLVIKTIPKKYPIFSEMDMCTLLAHE